MRLSRQKAVRHWETCLHEAAHADVAEGVGMVVRCARVWDPSSMPPSYTAFMPAEVGLEKSGMVLAAGRLAEELWGVEGPPPLREDLDGGYGCAGDFRGLAVRLEDGDDSPEDAWLRCSLAVKAYWEGTGGEARVKAIARRLSLRGGLLGSEVEAVRREGSYDGT